MTTACDVVVERRVFTAAFASTGQTSIAVNRRIRATSYCYCFKRCLFVCFSRAICR